MPANQSSPQWSLALTAGGRDSSCEVSVSLEDVTVDFSREEWQQLNSTQRRLYQEVMLENYSHLLSVGYEVPKPEVIFKLEQGEEPWILEGETPHQSCSDGKFGIKISQKRISGKASFHSEMEGEDIRDDSLYSILELWQDAEQMKRYQEKHSKPEFAESTYQDFRNQTPGVVISTASNLLFSQQCSSEFLCAFIILYMQEYIHS